MVNRQIFMSTQFASLEGGLRNILSRVKQDNCNYGTDPFELSECSATSL